MIIKNKALFLLFIIFIFSAKFSFAAEDSDAFGITLKWLNKTLVENDWNYNVDEISFGILSLKSKNYNIQDGVDRLIELKSSDGSWNGNIQDTSLAIIALYNAGKKDEIKDSISWLLDKQQKASSGGDWLLQIVASNEGDCDVSLSGQEAPVTFFVNSSGVNCDYDGNGDNFGSWIDLEKCAGFNIDMNGTIGLNCNNLGRFDASLIFRFANNYYILEDKTSQQRRSSFDIENTFFGNYDDTLYATWALSEVGKDPLVHTLPYLSTNFRENIILDRAILYLITQKQGYINYLRNVQNNLTGSFDRSVYVTSFAVIALKDDGGSQSFVSNALEWLKNDRIININSKDYGSFDGSVRDTAVALYAIYFTGRGGGGSGTGTGAGSAYCGDLIINGNEQCDAKYSPNGTLEDGDASNCKGSLRCIAPGLVGQCTCKVPVQCTKDLDCGTGEKCGLDGKCVQKISENATIPEPECTSDFQCNVDVGEYCDSDGNCVVREDFCIDDSYCLKGEKCDKKTQSCVEKKTSYWWVITLIILLVAGLLVFYFSKKKGGFKIKKKADTQNQISPLLSRPQVKIPQTRGPVMAPPPRNYHDEQLEKELDRSIFKARELLKKKPKGKP